MLIVFDSHDLVGKTPVANIVSRVFEIPFPKEFTSQGVKLPVDQHVIWAKAQYALMTNLQNSLKFDMIMDRWYMSEACYSKVIRGYTPDYITELEKKINDNVIWFYFCFDENIRKEAIEYRLSKDDDEIFKADQILKVAEEYDHFFDKSKLKNKYKIVETTIDFKDEICDVATEVSRILYEDFSIGKFLDYNDDIKYCLAHYDRLFKKENR